MKRKFLAIALMITTLVGSSITVLAQGTYPTVTFNEDKVLEYGNVTEAADGSISLGNAFEAVLPGETRSQVIVLKNDNDQTVDFYMSADVVQSLESANRASGAAYEIQLTSGENVFYDSTLGGYDAASEGSVDGLAEMNESLEGDIFVTTLEKGESAEVVLSITFDGEAMDNTSLSDYSNALGALDFNFKAGYEEPNSEEIVDVVVTKKGDTIYVKEVIEIEEEPTPLAVKTGDNTMIFGAVLVLVMGVVLFLLTGKKKDKKNAAVFVGALLCFSLSAMDVSAASTYTVTYRPGNVGNFALADTTATDVKTMAEEVAEAMGYSYDYEVTENGAIKLYVPKGASVPAPPSYIVTEGNYFAKNALVWGPAQGAVVEKNIDFVVDYGKLVDGVEYTIQYLDSEDGSSVAPVAIAYGNIGAEETAVAPETIVLSGATTYVRDSQATQSIVLSEDASENVITFYYTATFIGDVTENIIYRELPGETVVVTEYVTIPGTPVENPGAVLAPGQEEVQIPEEEIPLVPAPGGEEQNPPEPEGPVEPSTETPVEIPEEDVPLASAPSNEGDKTMDIVEIGEEEIPLADVAAVEENKNGSYILLGVALVMLLAVAAVWIRVVGRAKVVEKTENSEE